MHIPVPSINENDSQILIDDLRLLIEQPSARESPPCPNCFDEKDSVWDKKKCSAACVNATHALSEDPVRYPIEENVIPLVFELTTMRLVHTCWSCEGHMDIDGELWKLPQVSFYADRPIYAQLISNYLAHIYWKKLINYPWEIAMTNYGRLWDITYTIKCDLSRVRKPDIMLMQKDLLVMSENLSSKIKEDAKNIIRKIRSEK